jgi:hypothetical protein
MEELASRPVLEFVITGGTPPPSYEMVKLYEDGTVKSLVGNAWPQGRPQNEAGIYEMSLAHEDLVSIQQGIRSSRLFRAQKTYGQLYADSGKELLRLFTGRAEKTIKWSPYAKLAPEIEALRNRLLDILNQSKQLPVNVVRAYLTLESDAVNDDGHSFGFMCHVENPGRDNVKILYRHPDTPLQEAFISYLLKPAEEVGGAIVPLIEIYHKGKQIRARDRLPFEEQSSAVDLLPNMVLEFSVKDTFDIQSAGEYVILAMLELPIEFSWEGQMIVVNCVLATPPLKIYFSEKG